VVDLNKAPDHLRLKWVEEWLQDLIPPDASPGLWVTPPPKCPDCGRTEKLLGDFCECGRQRNNKPLVRLKENATCQKCGVTFRIAQEYWNGDRFCQPCSGRPPEPKVGARPPEKLSGRGKEERRTCTQCGDERAKRWFKKPDGSYGDVCKPCRIIEIALPPGTEGYTRTRLRPTGKRPFKEQ